jgi:hypothetical protein
MPSQVTAIHGTRPQFRPIEGYTSFLWIAILEMIWRWFAMDHPRHGFALYADRILGAR